MGGKLRLGTGTLKLQIFPLECSTEIRTRYKKKITRISLTQTRVLGRKKDKAYFGKFLFVPFFSFDCKLILLQMKRSLLILSVVGENISLFILVNII